MNNQKQPRTGKRRGSALIIGIALSTLILIFSVQMVEVIINVNNNTARSLQVGATNTAREGINNRIELLAESGENPLAEDNNNILAYEDYSRFFTVGNITTERDVWVSSGCPVPNAAPNNRNNYDYPTSELGVPADVTRDQFYVFDENDRLAETISMADKCYPEGYEYSNAPHYYVYPTPHNNPRNRKALTVGYNCEAGELYDEINGEKVNPLDHPCYWGKIEPGESLEVSLNRFGRDLGEIENLQMRVRLACPDKQEWCTYEERVGDLPDPQSYIVENENGIEIDTSPLLANWTLTVEDTGEIWTSAKAETRGNLGQLECGNRVFCRHNSKNTEFSVLNIINNSTINLLDIGARDFFAQVSYPHFSITRNQYYFDIDNINIFIRFIDFVIENNRTSDLRFQVNNLYRLQPIEVSLIKSVKNY